MIPGSVPAEVALIRIEEVAVAVGSVRAYPNGFEFTLHGRIRHGDEVTARGRADPFDLRSRGSGESLAPEDVLRLGLLYADGRRTATTAGRPDAAESGESLILMQEGGGGNGRRWDWDFWVHPLPPDGAVILWPEEPEGESTTSWRSSKITSWGG